MSQRPSVDWHAEVWAASDEPGHHRLWLLSRGPAYAADRARLPARARRLWDGVVRDATEAETIVRSFEAALARRDLRGPPDAT